MSFPKRTRQNRILNANSILDFGKYEGKTVSSVLLTDPNYLAFVRGTVAFVVFTADILRKLPEKKAKRRFI